MTLYPGPSVYPSDLTFPGVDVVAPVLPKVQLPDQGGQGLRVAFYDLNYTLQGYANDYESCAVTFQHLDVGTGSLVVAETSPVVPWANLAGQQVVPVTVTDRFGNRWSGRVDSPSTDEGDGSSQTVPGSGLTTITLVDEWSWFKRLLAAPWGASTQMAYTAPSTDPEFDIRTGPIHTVVKGYITDALARVYGVDVSGIPLGPIVVVPPPIPDVSSVVTLQAKWTPIADLVTDTLHTWNWALTIRLWLPGDDPPVGLVTPLTAPTLVVDMHRGANNPWIIWDDDNFLTRKVAVKSPASFGGVFGGDGSGTAQTFSAYVDAGLQASQGLFGFPEQFFSSSTSTAPQVQLEATEGSLAVDATVQDGAPWTYGQDYIEGDIVGVRALGIDVRERVTAVQMVDDRDKGYRLVPTVGDDAATLTPTAQLFRSVRELGTRVASIETGR